MQAFPRSKSQTDRNLRWSETLRDRSHVLIRPLGMSDRAAMLEFAEAVQNDSPLRFRGQVAEPERIPGDDASQKTERAMTFVAIVHQDSQERIVGISEFKSSGHGLRCECTVSIDREWREKGLAVLLMRHLIEVAKGRGVRFMHSRCSAENTGMSDLAHFLGFRTRMDPDDPSQLIHELTI